MTDRVLLDRDGRVATITVNQPEKRNAMDVPTREELREAVGSVRDDGEVRVVVFRGAGDAFVAGGDIEAFAEFDHMDGLEYATKYAQGLYNEVAELPTPTVAAVDGPALGGGTELALACDVRLASTDATFGLPEVGLGILPAGGGTQRLARTVGAGIARELILTGRVIDAAEAEEVGLANHVYPPDEFEAEVAEMAESLASRAPVAQRLAKAALDRGLNDEAGLDFERLAGAFAFATEDREEGMRAFLEDRDPEYEGR